jgi:hypothetical protein
MNHLDQQKKCSRLSSLPIDRHFVQRVSAFVSEPKNTKPHNLPSLQGTVPEDTIEQTAQETYTCNCLPFEF